MFFDFVIEAPTRFSHEVRRAAEHVVADIKVAACRPRFLLQEIMTEADVIDALARIAKRGSQGVCLKARDAPGIRKAVDDLAAAGIPVVTLVTDITSPTRVAYVGLDNKSAGRTAAYLVAQTLAGASGTVLTTKSQDQFLGEEERESAFLQLLTDACPNLSVIDASGGSGVPYQTAHSIEPVLERLKDLRAVYSMGGGNRTILEMLSQNRLSPDIYVAHDLDRENRRLIESGRLSFVLHHDLTADMQNVFRAFLHHHKLAPDRPENLISNVQVVTRYNLPPRV